jgi:Holliday junction resolvase RusA-like endonuclease
MTVTLPYPPTTNHAYVVRAGRKVKSADARAYAGEVGWRIADELRLDPHEPRPTPQDRLWCLITMHAPDNRKRDLANIEKLALDALCVALDIDDSQIDQLTLLRGGVDRANPRLVVRLEPMPKTPAPA